MVFFLLTIITKQILDGGIAEYLLLPDIAPEQLHSEIYNAIVLAASWRLTRERPYVAASLLQQEIGTRYQAADLVYVESLPRLKLVHPYGTVSVAYIGQEDISPFVPILEDDFLLFLPEPPSDIILPWPNMIKIMNGVLLSQSDEYIKIQTADVRIMSLIEGHSFLPLS